MYRVDSNSHNVNGTWTEGETWWNDYHHAALRAQIEHDFDGILASMSSPGADDARRTREGRMSAAPKGKTERSPCIMRHVHVSWA